MSFTNLVPVAIGAYFVIADDSVSWKLVGIAVAVLVPAMGYWAKRAIERRHQRRVAKAAERILGRMGELVRQKRVNRFSVAELAADPILDLDLELVREAMEWLRTRGAVECIGGLYRLTQP